MTNRLNCLRHTKSQSDIKKRMKKNEIMTRMIIVLLVHLVHKWTQERLFVVVVGINGVLMLGLVIPKSNC